MKSSNKNQYLQLKLFIDSDMNAKNCSYYFIILLLLYLLWRLCWTAKNETLYDQKTSKQQLDTAQKRKRKKKNESINKLVYS